MLVKGLHAMQEALCPGQYLLVFVLDAQVPGGIASTTPVVEGADCLAKGGPLLKRRSWPARSAHRVDYALKPLQIHPMMRPPPALSERSEGAGCWAILDFLRSEKVL